MPEYKLIQKKKKKKKKKKSRLVGAVADNQGEYAES
jgi:hypothetical protein